MSAQYFSQFILDVGPEGEPLQITKGAKFFEDWLIKCGYRRAVACCPSDEGEFVGAEDAEDLLEDFFEQHPHMVPHEDELVAHAREIGQVGR